ncbi:MAG: hypothetical protein IAG13_38735 [Deltaproteobacteria bacterium]|nr:hypothetical protein [Nannocystaceae bacterium]
MRRHGLWIGWVAACSTAPLDGSPNSVGTFATLTMSAGSDPSSGDTSATETDPSVATSEPETSATATAEGSSGAGSTGSSSGSESGSGDSSTSDSGPDPLACSDGDLGQGLGNAVASGSLAGAIDDMAITCAGGGGLDAVYLWTAPAAGVYTFDLSGSDYQSAVAIFDPSCAGAELGCNDGAVAVNSSLTVDLVVGQQVLVVIEGVLGSVGNYVLDINSGPGPDFACADGGDLGSALGSVASGSTVGLDDTFTASCASEGADTVFVWTAPAAASYTFSLAGSDYDTLLTVQSPDCGGAELACNDDSGTLQSSLDLALAADQTVLVVVDGYNVNSGNFTLSIL